MALVVVDGEVAGRRADVRVVGERIAAVGPGLRRRGDVVLDAGGGAVLPGLHDHHVHLIALAATRRSVDVRAVRAGGLGAALAGAPPVAGWVRAIGFHEDVHGPLDRGALDALVPDRPVRVQHQTGRRWILNSAALHAVGGLDRFPDGIVDGADDWLRGRVPHVPLDLAAVGGELARYGVTGCTDATPSTDPGDFAVLAAAGLPQRLVVTGGLALAAVVPAAPLRRGPVKLVVDDAALPSPEDLGAAIAAARSTGRTVAVHAVTLAAAVLVVAAWEAVGAVDGDRLEHGAVLPPELVVRLASLGVRVVTQPSFVRERGDRYRRTVERADLADLYPCRRLLDAGVRVAGSTDAPYGDADPWRAMRAAVERTTAAGVPLGADEAVGSADALGLFLGAADDPGGPSRAIAPGAAADLCVLDVPLDAALADLDAAHVAATVIGGAVVWAR